MSTLANEDDEWLDRVRCGDFTTIPEHMTWLQSARLAHLLHCYRVSEAIGFGDLNFWADERAEEAAMTGEWRGGATDLLLCLGFEHRRFRHFGFEPAGDDRLFIDQLEQALRRKLLAVGEPERELLVAQFRANGLGKHGTR